MCAMNFEEIKRRKQELRLTNQELSSASGVPLGTLQKILNGETRMPRKETVKALARVLEEKEAGGLFSQAKCSSTPFLKEETAVYGFYEKKPGEFTKEDYYALPETTRTELMDGVFYDLASPTRLHQGILLGIAFQLEECLQKHPGRCFLYVAPSDVELDEKTVVQPDIYVHCHAEKENLKPLAGAPDFIIEILSPSDPGRDIWKKQELYRRAGVREYWVCDPEQKKVMVFLFDTGEFPRMYSFDEKVPVTISEDACEVDFRKVYKRVEHLY